MGDLQQLRSHRVGLALSGGSVRGLAHIGVFKVLREAGIVPVVIAGTSAGSLVGAMFASGMEWNEVASLARGTFWPRLLHGAMLERFCAQHLPATFAGLKLPFAAIATELPGKGTTIITRGELASAISASCALRPIRRSVVREGKRLKDGGIACVLPSEPCRALGADFIIGSDVCELGLLLRGFGMDPRGPRVNRAIARIATPPHYHRAIHNTDLLIHTGVPLAGYMPGPAAVDRMISAGEKATWMALNRLAGHAA